MKNLIYFNLIYINVYKYKISDIDPKALIDECSIKRSTLIFCLSFLCIQMIQNENIYQHKENVSSQNKSVFDKEKIIIEIQTYRIHNVVIQIKCQTSQKRGPDQTWLDRRKLTPNHLMKNVIKQN